MRGELVERLSWVPDGIDLDRPSAARVYDYYLGGSHNFAVDRAMGRQVVQLMPEVPRIARANRAFLGRVVKYLVDAGVRQFLDIGSGIPTAGNVHEIAHQANPDVRVAYVDIDPVAVAHSRTILRADDRSTVVQADLRQPGQVLSTLDETGLFDFGQPVAVLVISMLHFIPDSDDPTGVMARYRDAFVSGSYLALSHIHRLAEPVPRGDEILEVYARVGTPLTPRTEAGLTAFFEGYELVEPGLAPLPLWRPESPDDVERSSERLLRGFRVGVGRKP